MKKKKPCDFPEDWDEEVESLLDYCARKTRESAENAIAPYHSDAQTTPQDNASPREVLDLAIGDELDDLVARIRRCETIEDQVNAMQFLARWLADQADQLLARNPADFHRSQEWH